MQEAELVDGVILISPWKHPVRCYAWTGEKSLNVSASLCALALDGDIFLDIGGFVGQHSIRMAKLIAPSGRVILFEPDYRNWPILEQNITRSGVKVEVRKEAISIETGFTNFSLKAVSLSGIPELKGTTYNGNERLTIVPCVSISSQLDKYQPSIIKIDVEGYDGVLLEEILNKSVTYLRALIIEANTSVNEIVRKQDQYNLVAISELSSLKGKSNDSQDYLLLRKDIDIELFKLRFLFEYQRLLKKPKVKFRLNQGVGSAN